MKERAHALLAARDEARKLPLFSETDAAFSLADAYALADEIRMLRIERGERPLGYKIGFTNRRHLGPLRRACADLGSDLGHHVEFVPDGEAMVSLAPFVQPRLEPEIMFAFAREPRAGMSEAELAGCIEWVAHGYEIVHTHFEAWRFKHTDTVANFALHGRLFVGKPVPIATFADAPRELASVHVALRRDGQLIDEGDSSIVLDGPLSALRIWVDAMAAQPQAWPIVAGDIVTTGTITDAAPMYVGQRFDTTLSDARLPGVTLRTEA